MGLNNLKQYPARCKVQNYNVCMMVSYTGIPDQAISDLLFYSSLKFVLFLFEPKFSK